MFSFFTKLLDRVVIKLACGAQPKPGTFDPHIKEAHDVLAQADFLDCHVNAPKEMKWKSEEEFEFPSIIESPWPENNVVYAKLQRCGEDWRKRPTVVLVHGWNDEIGYALRHPFQARQFLKVGINVAQIELPYHLRRRPRRVGAVNDFLTEDLRCTLLAVKQAVTDIRSVLAWLRDQGCEQSGLMGVSLGGWLTGLVAAHEENVKFAVMNVPITRMDRAVNELAFAEPLRRSLKSAEAKGIRLDLGKLNLLSYRPKAAADKILIIEAVDDLFACKEAIEELWQAWEKPEIWRVQHAHISGLFSPGLLKRQVHWVKKKTLSEK